MPEEDFKAIQEKLCLAKQEADLAQDYYVTQALYLLAEAIDILLHYVSQSYKKEKISFLLDIPKERP